MVKIKVAGFEDASAGAFGDLFEQNRIAAETEILGRIRHGESADGLLGSRLGTRARSGGDDLVAAFAPERKLPLIPPRPNLPQRHAHALAARAGDARAHFEEALGTREILHGNHAAAPPPETRARAGRSFAPRAKSR